MKKIFLLTIIFILLFSTVVLADIGPKPRIDVYVENLPEEEYYLDLFIDEEISEDFYGNLDDEVYNEKIMNQLEKSIDGWRSASIYGTKTPLFIDLKGSIEKDRRLHSFSYVGTPKVFKIAIATEDDLVLSNVIERKNYQSTYLLDFQEFMEKEIVTGGGLKDFRFDLFLKTLVFTLIIEGIVFYLFKFDFKIDGLVFLLGNIFTQLGLHFYFMKSGYNLFLFFLGEIFVILIETIIFTIFFKGGTKKSRISFSVVSNLLSMVFGVILWTKGFF